MSSSLTEQELQIDTDHVLLTAFTADMLLLQFMIMASQLCLYFAEVQSLCYVSFELLQKQCKSACRDRLEELDISWCRNVPLEALGMLADSCVALKKLHIWGCSQICEQFLYGHSNDSLDIFGGKLDSTAPESARIVLSVQQ